MVWNHRRYGTPFPILDPEFRAQTEFPSQLYRPQPEFHRPLSEGGTGLAVVPDFLCKNAIESGEIQLIWEGKKNLKIPFISDAEKNELSNGNRTY